jgi:hypothetical protein
MDEYGKYPILPEGAESLVPDTPAGCFPAGNRNFRLCVACGRGRILQIS